jgi:hypothetical protein
MNKLLYNFKHNGIAPKKKLKSLHTEFAAVTDLAEGQFLRD